MIINTNKSEIYNRIFLTKVKEIVLNGDGSYFSENWKHLAFYGIKHFNYTSKGDPSNFEEAQRRFELLGMISDFVGMLTPNEFMNIFPPTKKYDGHKWGVKDFHSTMEHISTLDKNEYIFKQEEPLQFLFEYENEDVFKFSVSAVMTIGNMCKWQGVKTPMEQFIEEDNITTYSNFKSNGKEYMKNNQTGEITKANKPLPRGMRVIK